MCFIVSKVFFLLIGLLVCLTTGMAQHEYFPGLRRPPSAKISSNAYDENYLTQILNFIEEQARRRFQQKVVGYQREPSSAATSQEQERVMESGFTYQFPSREIQPIDDTYEFAVKPDDPRFYESSSNNEGLETQKDNLFEENNKENDDEQILKVLDDGPYYRIKGPINVNPKIKEINKNYGNSLQSSHSTDVLGREMEGLMHKNDILKSGNAGGYDTHLLSRSDVIQKPLDVDAPVGMYLVALIAGVSAAITVGLIAVGIGWYTFYKKSKAAADVEYPAYGVTGPNKEISPSGDRRLAQSAQMYHYQHQKQQIIAMENNSSADRNGSLSDVNSDDENEEGDYTVYECPGLAPTGEMEVKNPLFFDDPTPATPANANSAQQQTKTSSSSSTTTTTTNTIKTDKPKE